MGEVTSKPSTPVTILWIVGALLPAVAFNFSIVIDVFAKRQVGFIQAIAESISPFVESGWVLALPIGVLVMWLGIAQQELKFSERVALGFSAIMIGIVSVLAGIFVSLFVSFPISSSLTDFLAPFSSRIPRILTRENLFHFLIAKYYTSVQYFFTSY